MNGADAYLPSTGMSGSRSSTTTSSLQYRVHSNHLEGTGLLLLLTGASVARWTRFGLDRARTPN
jgi:hypothetical protein